MLRRGRPLGRAIDAKAFGIHYRSPTSFSVPQTPFFETGCGSLRLWDTKAHWINIETSKGVFNWSRLDAYVAFAQANGMHILYTLGQPPAWATGGVKGTGINSNDYNDKPPDDIQDWIDFITALVPRLPAGSAYEVWNEVSLPAFWSGNNAQLIELHQTAYETIKALDPTAIIVSACTVFNGVINTAWQYLPGFLPSVADYVDVIGVHSYNGTAQPERMIDIVNSIKAYLNSVGIDKPIWNTEYTWNYWDENGVPNTGPLQTDNLNTSPGVMPESRAAGYAARAVLSLCASPAERNYFYGVDFWWSALRLVTDLSVPTTETSVLVAIRYAIGLLTGGCGVVFESAGGQVYRARFQTAQLKIVTAMWCRDYYTTTIDTTGYSDVRDVLGQTVAKSASYTLTSSPIYCFN